MNLGNESEIVEVKKSTSLLKKGIKSMVAILNKHNEGTLFFGINDDGDIVGQDIFNSTIRDISKHIKDYVQPMIYPEIKRIPIENSQKEYIRVRFAGDCQPYSYKSKFYLRIATSDSKMSEKDIRYQIRPIEKNTFIYPYEHRLTIGNFGIYNIHPKAEIEKLLKNLWEEIFSTDLLPFERCLTIGNEISLSIEYLVTVKDYLSSSEKYFLSLFLSNYNTKIVAE
ncbi:MAG: ATP-binding protein [Defluviitaleaceae bacterium]|nr:ATP-binding protein [Defluviitaleaceae bacterium]MCL2273389.1 ATP-binding protein [Defluviitaleaceae bacterium]